MARVCKPLMMCCLLALMLGSTALAELTVATIDMQEVFDSYYRAKRFEKELRGSADMEYLVKLESEVDSLKSQLQEIVSRDQSYTISEEAKKENREQGRQLISKIQEKENDVRTVMRKIEKRKLEERRAVLKELTEVITAHAKDNAIDLLLDSSGVTSNGIPPVIFANEKMDITQTIIERSNQGHEAEIKELDAAIEAADAKRRAERAAEKPEPNKE